MPMAWGHEAPPIEPEHCDGTCHNIANSHKENSMTITYETKSRRPHKGTLLRCGALAESESPTHGI